jgi:hypothetical protein
MPFDLAGIHPFGDKQACQAVKNDKLERADDVMGAILSEGGNITMRLLSSL